MWCQHQFTHIEQSDLTSVFNISVAVGIKYDEEID